MRKILTALLALIMAFFCFTACANDGSNGGNNGENGGVSGGIGGDEGGDGGDEGEGGDSGDEGEGGDSGDEGGGGAAQVPTSSNVLVVYFSCTNTTEAIAKHIEKETKGTLHEIAPEIPYTADDLKYYTDCRADREQADSAARPAINGSVENIDKYDVVFLGYPIWHGQAPRIIYTFLESYDFSGKTIVPFCTSHSSGIGNSDVNLHSLAPSAEWVAGRRFASGTSQKSVADWIDGLDIKLL